MAEAATFAGHDERALVAFAWCLALSDDNPGRFDARDLMWRYKWIVGGLSSFPQISLSKMHEALEDFHRRCRDHGYGERSYLSLRWYTEWNTGKIQEAKQAYRKMRQTSHDSLTDCAAGERDREVEWFAALREDEKALESAAPIVRGRFSCNNVPALTFARLLEVHYRLGDLDAALACHRSGYRLVARNRAYLESAAKHLSYLAETGELAKGLKLVERHLPWALDSFDLEARLDFYGACCRLTRLLSRANAPGGSSVCQRRFRSTATTTLTTPASWPNGFNARRKNWPGGSTSAMGTTIDRACWRSASPAL